MIIMAMAGAFWAYDGWINVTYMSGEIKDVQRNLPKAMAIAVIIVIAVYVLVNLAYIYVIPVHEMAQNYRAAEASGGSYIVAIDVANSFLGRWGGAMIAVAIMVSTFGAVNGTTMMSARVYFAMAREGLFFRSLGEVHPRFRTPGSSLVVQGIWTSMLVLSGTFDQLTDMLIFVSWIFYALAAASVFTLRRRMPDAPRPYKVWGYPVTPILFIAFASIYVVFTLYTDIPNFRSGTLPADQLADGPGLGRPGHPGLPLLEPEAEARGRRGRARDIDAGLKDNDMIIEYFHASKFGNGERVAEEFKKRMAGRGVTVNIHHVRDATPRNMPPADLYLFSSPGRMGRPIGRVRRFLKKLELPSGTKYALLTTEGAARPDKKTGKMPTEEEIAKWQRVRPIMNELLEEKGLIKVAEAKIEVAGLKGPLENGWPAKVEAFAALIPLGA